MKLNPILNDPLAVLVSAIPLVAPPGPEDFRRAARQALEVLQVELEGERVVLKPNLTVAETFANPDSGITTHPDFLRGIVDYLHNHGAPSNFAHGERHNAVAILEDPRNHDNDEPRHWRGTGLLELAEATGVELHCPQTQTCVSVPVPHPLAHATLDVSRLAIAPDTVLFNVPKLKTHNLGITTLCLKNLMGVVNAPDRHYCAQAWAELPVEVRDNPRPRAEWLDRATHERWQHGLARRLADTAQVVRPALNLVEGVVAREGTGFQRGCNLPTGLVIAGINMVAVDSVASYLMGFDPQQLIYLQVAVEAGLGVNDLKALRVYVAQDGLAVPCADLETLRIEPPLRVITNTAGEPEIVFSDSPQPDISMGRVVRNHKFAS